jgi:hypothetical protein
VVERERVRALNERPIFGKVRFIYAAGLERTYDVGAYVDRVKSFPADPA